MCIRDSNQGGHAALEFFQERKLSGIGDASGQARFTAGRARRQITAEADSHQRDFGRIDLRPGDGEIDHRADDGFPVRSRDQAVLNPRRALARPVEDRCV